MVWQLPHSRAEVICALNFGFTRNNHLVQMPSIALWLHRRLTAAGIENRVVDAASIPVERRSRRRKTDRIDLELLIRMLLALERGETRICRVIQVPTPAEEDAKRQHRERAVLVKEKTAHTNRIGGILMAL